MTISIETFIYVMIACGSLVGVYVRLNNKIIELKAFQKYQTELTVRNDEKISALEQDLQKAFKEFSTELHKSNLLIEQVKTKIDKHFTK